jgi:hypothetical protein
MKTPVVNTLEAKTLVQGRVMRVLIVTAFAAIAGCVVGGGYDGGATVGYDVGFYEPFGYDYGGWGPGYGVGLPRRGYDRGGRPDVHSAPHPSYRPAAPSRSMPSLPSHSRGR